MCAVRKYSVSDANMRLPEFTKRFRTLVDDYGGVSKLSDNSGISRTTINFWYNGERTPGAEYLITLSQSLGVSVDYLLGISDYQPADASIRAACEYTGLSSEAVTKLHDIHFDVQSKAFISQLITEHGKSSPDIYSYISDATDSQVIIDNSRNAGEADIWIDNHLSIYGVRTKGAARKDGCELIGARAARNFKLLAAAQLFRDFGEGYVKAAAKLIKPIQEAELIAAGPHFNDTWKYGEENKKEEQ